MLCKLYLNEAGKNGLKEKSISRNKEGYLLMKREAVQREGITAIDIYVPDNRASAEWSPKLEYLKDLISKLLLWYAKEYEENELPL